MLANGFALREIGLAFDLPSCQAKALLELLLEIRDPFLGTCILLLCKLALGLRQLKEKFIG